MLVNYIFGFLLLFLLYILLSRRYARFKGTGVPYTIGAPLLGIFWRFVFRLRHSTDDIQDVYDNVGDDKSRFIGIFNSILPIVLVKDPELIRQLAGKDSGYVNEHSFLINEYVEPLFGQNLVSLKGQKWRDMRISLTPAFTSSKMRDMFGFIKECGKQMNEYFIKDFKEGDVNLGMASVEVELKDLACRYTNDVIASAIFGLQVDSYKDKDNEFYIRGKTLTETKFSFFLKLSLSEIYPKLTRLLGVRLYEKDQDVFYSHVVLSAMKYREQKNIQRKDMIHLLAQVKKGSLRSDTSSTNDTPSEPSEFLTGSKIDTNKRIVKTVWTDDDIVAQAMVFYFAGFDSGASVISYILFEMSLNKTMQKKLQDEIDRTNEQCDGNLTYEALHEMKYLDMVLSEGLRKYPSFPLFDRVATQDIDLGPIKKGSTKTYTVKKGESIWIPVLSIQRDGKFWTDPGEFIPERFSPENKDNIVPYTYIPFGFGPRNCIGSRFALMQLKTMLFYLLSEFEIERSHKTKVPYDIDLNSYPSVKPKGGLWAKLKPRKK